MIRRYQVTIEGVAPYSQSRKVTPVDENGKKVPPSRQGEWDLKNWRKKMHVGPTGHVVIPGSGLKQSIESAAKIALGKIEGKGNAKWAGLFLGGMLIIEDFVTDVLADDVQPATFSCDTQGNRGDYSSKRVDRTFPMVKPGWRARGEIALTNDEIPEEKLVEALTGAGCFVGVGRYRPSKGGSNGRFIIVDFEEVTDAAAA